MPRRPSLIRGTRQSVGAEARKAFRIDGIDELTDKISKILNSMTGREAKEVYYEAAVILRDQARANAPYGAEREKGTHLRDAIFASRGDESKPDVLVGVRYRGGAPHAHFVEYGTAKWSGHPYFRPAITQSGARIASVIKDGLSGIIERHSK